MKESFLIYKLHFTSPLHNGDSRDDYSISLKSIASDTMYAALMACLAKIGKAIPNDGNLGFTISSLFPFYQREKEIDKETVYFFPKPFKRANFNTNDLPNAIERAKDIKNIKWVDIDFFNRIINNEEILIDDAGVLNGSFLTAKSIDKDFISSQVLPRVKVPRDYHVESDATPFYMDRIHFKDYSGLYFIVNGDTTLLDVALHILQHEGIGTDRNVGNGLFSFSQDKIELELPDKSKTEYALSLSMFIPESKGQLSAMLSGENAGYDFNRRGGWITTPPFSTYRKNAIYAFTQGSVFSMKMEDNVEVRGRIVDLKPEIEFEQGKINHPIWRNGKSLFIPIKL